MSAPTRPKKRGDRPRVALVLSGGGARGAYEAVVMRYIREDLAGDLGGQVSVFFVLVVAAAEVVVGLALIVAVLRRRPGATADDVAVLKG